MVPPKGNPVLTTHALRRAPTTTTDCTFGPQGKKKRDNPQHTAIEMAHSQAWGSIYLIKQY